MSDIGAERQNTVKMSQATGHLPGTRCISPTQP